MRTEVKTSVSVLVLEVELKLSNVGVRAGTKLEGGMTPHQSWNGRANHLDWQGNERF
jgi:hypothetical protein